MRKAIKLSHGSMITQSNMPADVICHEAERRDHDRYLTIFRAVKLTSGKVERLCVARNLSSGGVMVDVATSYTIGQNICVSFTEDQNFAGQVIWQRAVTIGIKFDSEIDVKQVLEKPQHRPDGYKRRLPRIQICQQAKLRVGNRLLLIELHDISQSGARIKTDHEFCKGESVEIIVPGLAPIQGMVRWRQNGFAGLEFSNTLPLSALMQWRSGSGTNLAHDV
jgi:PilZ domain